MESAASPFLPLLIFLILVIVYAYIGYPPALRLLLVLQNLRGNRGNRGNKENKSCDANSKQATCTKREEIPFMTLILPMYNEKSVVERKLENTRGLLYPPDRLEIIVISDGSTDGTPQIIEGVLKKHPHHFTYVKLEKNGGKFQAIAKGVKLAKGELIGVTDASTQLDPQALLAMSRAYQNPQVGAASSHYKVLMTAQEQCGMNLADQKYFEYENKLKELEKKTGSIIVLQGAFYSFRRQLFIESDKKIINDDFYVPCQTLLQGWKVGFAEDCFSYELNPAEVHSEFFKRSRIAAGHLQCFLEFPSLLNPWKFGEASFKLFSHKILRLLSPFLLLASLLLNLILWMGSGPHHPVVDFLLICQLGFYFLALVGLLMNTLTSLKVVFFHVPFYFLMTNLAIMNGVLRYFFLSQKNIRWNSQASIETSRFGGN